MKFRGAVRGCALGVLLAACAAARLSADDPAGSVRGGHTAPAYESPDYRPFPPVTPEVPFYPGNSRFLQKKIVLTPFLSFDRVGGFYVDVNPAMSLEIKPVPGSFDWKAESRTIDALLSRISLTLHVRY